MGHAVQTPNFIEKGFIWESNQNKICIKWPKHSLCLVDFGVIENSLLSFMAIFLPAISSYMEDRYSSGRSLLSLIPRFILMYCSFVILFFTYIHEQNWETVEVMQRKGGNWDAMENISCQAIQAMHVWHTNISWLTLSSFTGCHIVLDRTCWTIKGNKDKQKATEGKSIYCNIPYFCLSVKYFTPAFPRL